MASTLRLTPPNEKKLGELSVALNLSRQELMNLLVSAVDEVEIRAMAVERAVDGTPRPRKVVVRPVVSWTKRY